MITIGTVITGTIIKGMFGTVTSIMAIYEFSNLVKNAKNNEKLTKNSRFY